MPTAPEIKIDITISINIKEIVDLKIEQLCRIKYLQLFFIYFLKTL